MGVLVLRQEGAGRVELPQDGDVGGGGALLLQVLDAFERRHPDQVRGDAPVVKVGAVVPDGAVDLEPVLEPRLVVLRAVPGRGVHAPGAAVHGHVVGEDDRGGAVDEGMAGARCSSERPATVFTTCGASLSPAAAATCARSAEATRMRSAPRSATAYSTSGLSAIARFAGRVHGVVVQMTMREGLVGG